MDNKRTIAIVCGGDSSEHEVSLRSAQGLYSFFDHDRYNIYIVVIKGLDWHVNLPNGDKAPIDRNDFSFIAYGVKTRFDYAYITIHGTPGENGIMQGYFDLLRIPYSTCNVLVESLTFDKFALIRYIRAFGVNTAKSILVRNDDKERPTPEEIEAVVGMPCFVKPVANGSSFGVSKVKSADQLEQAIQKAFGEGDDATAPRKRLSSSLSPRLLLITSSSTTMPSTTDKFRKSRPRASATNSPPSSKNSRRASMASCTATASFASTTSSRTMRTARGASICSRLTLLRA